MQTSIQNSAKLLDVRNLSVVFPTREQKLVAVNDVSFSLGRGEKLGLVGESGAGKSVTGFSILNLVSAPGYISAGQVLFEGRNLADLKPSELRHIRGNRISMVFQDPMMTLNPVLSIGTQMTETLFAHRLGQSRLSRKAAEELAIECLRKVYIPSPEQRLKQYPHELSGGMRQRVVIAVALLTKPSLIVADEPTTALDVTIQAEIMDLLSELCAAENMGLILITHDLGVVSQVTDNIAVMYAGRIVETGPTAEVIANPLHPYTQGLLAALPQSAVKGERLNQIPGNMPTLTAIPPGCAFNPRCRFMAEICLREVPCLAPNPRNPRRLAACHITNKA